jgi:hypothetical protein
MEARLKAQFCQKFHSQNKFFEKFENETKTPKF